MYTASECNSCRQLAYSLTLKIEATCSSETSVEFQGTKRPHIPEENLNHSIDCFGIDPDQLSPESVFLIGGT
jgi:hypothetical protein